MARSLWPVKVLASDICEDIGDSTERYHMKIQKKILAGYKKLHMLVDHEVSIKSIILDADNSIEMPCDFLFETKVGVKQNGIIANLRIDKGMQKQCNLSDSERQLQIQQILSGSLSPAGSFCYYNVFDASGLSYGEMYGVGYGFNTQGVYDIDRTNGVINIGSLYPDGAQGIVEYKSDGISDGGLSLFPSEMEPALRYYAKWQLYIDTETGKGIYNQEMWEQEYKLLKRIYLKKKVQYYAGLFKETQRPAPR